LDCRPGCADVSVDFIEDDTGIVVFSLANKVGWALSWERKLSEPSAASLVLDNQVGDCCKIDLKPFCHSMRVFRCGELVACYQYLGFTSTSNSSLVMNFVSIMSLVESRPWLSDSDLSGSSNVLFGKVLDEASKVDQLPISEEIVGDGFQTGVVSAEKDFLANPINRLVSDSLNYVEYASGNDCYIVRYGDLDYPTGHVLTDSDWDDPPSIGEDGFDLASFVCVLSDDKTGDTPNFVGAWPPIVDGKYPRGGHCKWLPKQVIMPGLNSDGQATETARRIWESSQSGLFIGSKSASGVDSNLSKVFPVDVNSLLPGALFESDISHGCGSVGELFRLVSLEFDVLDGLEISVKADFEGV